MAVVGALSAVCTATRYLFGLFLWSIFFKIKCYLHGNPLLIGVCSHGPCFLRFDERSSDSYKGRAGFVQAQI